MSVYLITYDYNRPGQDYTGVLDLLKSYPHVRLAEGAFAIETPEATRTVYNKITKYLKPSTNVYILTVTKPFYSQCVEDVKKWLGSHLPQY
ncbi:MAG TPA: hypothetical protein VKS81_06945 [Bacteroidota bacterium]|nr:hypothetical protein [Bacteroidota bacterium]